MQTKPSTLDELGRAARIDMSEAKATLQDAAGKVQDEAMKAGRTISDMAMDELDRRVSLLGQNGRQIAGALRESSTEIDGPGSRVLGHIVDTLEDLSGRLENQSARSLAADVAQIGRDHPTAFMLGCLLTGVVAGRLIASGPIEGGEGSLSGSGQWADRSAAGTSGSFSRDTTGQSYRANGRNGRSGPDSTEPEWRLDEYDTPDSVSTRESDA